MSEPSVGVVIPSYNHARFLETAIESVLRQTRPPDRILVVDDGSTDESPDILQRIARVGWVEVRFQENRGAHDALNRGVEEVGTDLVFLLNSDDRYMRRRIERFVALFRQRPSLGLAGSWIRVVDQRGRRLGTKKGWANLPPWDLEAPAGTFQGTADPRDNLVQTNYLSTTSNFVFTRALWNECGPFRPLRYAHDWDFALRTAERAEVDLLPKALVQYRIHSANTIREDLRALEFEIQWVLASNLPARVASAGPEFLRRLLHSLPTFPDLRMLGILTTLAAADAGDGGRRLERLLDPQDPTRRALVGGVPGCPSL